MDTLINLTAELGCLLLGGLGANGLRSNLCYEASHRLLFGLSIWVFALALVATGIIRLSGRVA